MNIIVDKYIIDKENEIYFSANGFECVIGEIAHDTMFKLLKVYRQNKSTYKVSENYFICTMLEKFAKTFNWQLVENCESYSL